MEYIILLIALVGIVFGADYLVAGAVSITKKYKVSDFVIGAAIVGVGTSMPELVAPSSRLSLAVSLECPTELLATKDRGCARCGT